MSFNQLQELFSGQGLVFWLAVTAVAIGLTLLSVSIVYQVRKILANVTLPKFSRSAVPASLSKARPGPVQVTVTETGYQAQGYTQGISTAPVVTAVQPAGPDPILSQLLTRLQSSAERLEKIHNSLDEAPFPLNEPFESVLKVTGEDVDYLYKSERS